MCTIKELTGGTLPNKENYKHYIQDHESKSTPYSFYMINKVDISDQCSLLSPYSRPGFKTQRFIASK